MAGLTLQSVEPEADRCFTAPSHYSIFCQSMLLVVMMTNIANQLQPSGDDDHLVGDYSERDQSFYRTQVNLGSDLWVRMSVTE